MIFRFIQRLRCQRKQAVGGLLGATLSFVLSAAVMSELSFAQSPVLTLGWGALLLLSLLVQLLMLVLLAKKP
ncbi:hypothetical protein DLM_1160 [Aquitalea magnusonii]|jgi:hypothetical protein|uniref:Uncharacterized protein n=1 Tax=Aquitalea magnusonii TaxID=332411 RepID=A0A3G9GBE9_9NEIS|nr:hypothetical protein [Aquitalea magnusonii]BBF84785.1 hypothetical protein DLM_1160 [Aquitalea magnusonii]